MSDRLSDHLRAIRDHVGKRRLVGLFLLPCRVPQLIKRLNTLIAMADEQEAELRLAQAIIGDLPRGQTIIRFPKRTVIISASPGGDDAA